MSTTVNSVKLTFMAGSGEKFYLTLGGADPDLKTNGAEKINTAAASVIAAQPFIVQLASFAGAEFIDKTSTVIV